MKLQSLKTNTHGGWDVVLKEYNPESHAYDKKEIHDCQQEPLDWQLEALAAIKPIYMETCDFPKEWADNIDITGFTVSWQKNEHFKVTISGVRHLQQGGPLNIASPLRNVTAESEGAVNVMTDAQAILIDKAMNAAIEYYRGERKVTAKEVAHRSAYAKGEQAFKDGLNLLANPYSEETDGEDAVKSWIQGFTDAQQVETDEAEESMQNAAQEEELATEAAAE